MSISEATRQANIINYQPTEAEGAKMKPEQLEVLALYNSVFKPSYEDISAACEIPVGTVRSRLHRARKSLQRIRDAATQTEATNGV